MGSRTRRSLGHHLLHPLILSPRALFYSTDCTRRSKFLTHALPKYLFFHYYFLNFQIQTALSVSIYASPLIMTWLYRRDFFTSEGLAYLTKLGFGITLVYIFAFYVRGIGRVFNPVYRQFIDVHTRCMQNLSPENKVCALKLNNLRTK